MRKVTSDRHARVPNFADEGDLLVEATTATATELVVLSMLDEENLKQ